MAMEKFCPKCGKTHDPLVLGFCRECYLKDHDILELEAEFKIPSCDTCGKVKIRGNWDIASNETLKTFIESKLKYKTLIPERIIISLNRDDDKKVLVEVNIEGNIDGVQFTAQKEAILKLEGAFCDACMKLNSDYYECIVQLRFPKGTGEKKILKIMDEFGKLLDEQRAKDSLAQITKAEKEKYGVDLWIGSSSAAKKITRKIAHKYRAEQKTSYKIKKGLTSTGKPKKKFTYLVRFGD